MSCPYYRFYENDYYCCKKKDYVKEDEYYRYCRDYSYDDCFIYKEEVPSGGCYLTSACVEAMGLEDNCLELEILRSFRDNWLRRQPEGASEIADYYETAPAIVAAVRQAPDSQARLKALYDELVRPCVELIQAGNFEAAHLKYRNTALQLGAQYLAVKEEN